MTSLEFHPTKNNILLSGDKVSLTYSFCYDLVEVYVAQDFDCLMMVD